MSNNIFQKDANHNNSSSNLSGLNQSEKHEKEVVPNAWRELDNIPQGSVLNKLFAFIIGDYVQSSLFPDEKVLYWGRVSWLSQIRNIAFFFLIIPLIFAAINVLSTELALTNKRIITKFGVIRRETMELNLNRIESISVQQSFLGRILDYGTVVINGTGGIRTPVPYISKPFEFRQQVGRQIAS